MKYTAWPALAVIAAMVAARAGWRAGLAFSLAATGVAAALVAAFAPAAIGDPATIFQNTVAYPLGLTSARSSARSPLPGHLLATLGPGGHLAAIAALALAGLATAVSLIVAPPATPASAAVRIALGLTALFALGPASRWGYFVYPIALCAWAALDRSQRSDRDARMGAVIRGRAFSAVVRGGEAARHLTWVTAWSVLPWKWAPARSPDVPGEWGHQRE
jgi:hypothetical protein